MTELRTQRLRLRPWRSADREPFAQLNADPQVMRHFPAPLDRDGSDALADRIADGLTARGWGLWAVEIPGGAPFVGFVGLNPVPESIRAVVRGAPQVEVGWRLARSAWGRGYATEAATAALDHGFTVLKLSEIVSFTAASNARSRAVMRRLSMTCDPTDRFDNPQLPADSPLRPHILCRVARPGTPGRAGWAHGRPEQPDPPATD